MPETTLGQGRYLADLIQYYHRYRADFLRWAGDEGFGREEALDNYQRALLAWYEARVHGATPYVGDTALFVKSAALRYAGRTPEEILPLVGSADLDQNPLRYLPPTLRLGRDQQLMLRQFMDMSEGCRELLLLAYYHRLSDNRISTVLEMEGGPTAAADSRKHCLLLAREGWRENGLSDPIRVAPPEHHELIDRYRRNELEVSERWEADALRSSDLLFREAFERREDWEACLRVAGRQDTLETLKREEEDYRPPPEVVSPEPGNRRPGFSLPIGGRDVSGGWTTYVAVALTGVLAWLVFTTFAPNREQRLFRRFFTPLPPPTLVDANANDRDLDQMLRPYRLGDYLTAYEELLPAADAYPAAPLYLGISALAQDEPLRALQWFDRYQRGDVYMPYAEWYATLAYLALGRRPAALGRAIEIAGVGGHPYEDRAVELVEALE